MTDPLERIIRPIVEGQIRGFLKEHPSIAEAVDWYTPRRDKMQTLVNSLSKRIILDLLCAENRMRLMTALVAPCDCRAVQSVRGTVYCGGAGPAGTSSGRAG